MSTECEQIIQGLHWSIKSSLFGSNNRKITLKLALSVQSHYVYNHLFSHFRVIISVYSRLFTYICLFFHEDIYNRLFSHAKVRITCPVSFLFTGLCLTRLAFAIICSVMFAFTRFCLKRLVFTTVFSVTFVFTNLFSQALYLQRLFCHDSFL